MVNKSVVISDEIANISDLQLQKRLREEFNFNCGPITATTKAIYIKKLQELINSNVTTSTAKLSPVKQTTPSNLLTPKTRRKTLGTPVASVEIKKPESPRLTRRASVGRSSPRRITKVEIKPSISNFSDTETEDAVNESKPSTSINGQTALEYSRGSRLLKRSFNNRISSAAFTATKSTIPTITYKQKQQHSLPRNDSFSSGTENSYSVKKLPISSRANWISKSILIAVIVFFAFIFSFYFYSKYISSIGLNVEETELNALEKEFDINIQDLVIPGCLKTNDTISICSKYQIRTVLVIIKEIKNIVDRKLNNYYCLSGENLKDNPYEYNVKSLRNQIEMSIGKEVVEMARQSRAEKTIPAEPGDLFLSLFANALDLLNNNANLHMKPVGENGLYEKILIDLDYPKPLHTTCQVKLFIIRTFWWFLTLATVSAIAFLSFLYINRLKHEKDIEKELIFDLVNKSIELLQSPDEPQSLPILHVRDMLLDPSQRKLTYYQRIWNEVVHFIENNESRVKSSLENIDGEDYKTWKWVASSKNQPDSTNMKSTFSNDQINEWKNNLFNDNNTSSTNIQSQPISAEKISTTINTSTPIKNSMNSVSTQLKDFVALTRFLKVRNMVDKETVETDQDWKSSLCNSILQTCSKQSIDGKTHGIQHIHVGDRNDGLVYIKCESIEAASNAFKALHGTIQAINEKKLVSVKFLKDERYYNRFPEAKHLNDALKFDEI